MVENIHAAWQKSMDGLLQTPFFRRLFDGSLDIRHYQALLREIYYNTRENPASFASMAWHLKGRKREIAKKIYRHCAAEHGHHELALDDLSALGVDITEIPARRPLPTTEALIAFAVYNVQNANPLAYLGYVFHLEMLPAQLGGRIIAALAAMGVPKNAMSFLTEHAQADQAHSKWLDDYFRHVIESTEDLEAIIHGTVGSCKLHGIMLEGVVDSVPEKDDWKPFPSSLGSPAPKALVKTALKAD